MFEYLKQFSLEELLIYIANYSKYILTNCKQGIEEKEVIANVGERLIIRKVMITAWDLTDISYYSVINTSDKRNDNITEDDFYKIFNEYMLFIKNRDNGLNAIENDKLTLYTMYAYPQKQFWYQKLDEQYNMFNRNIEMLLFNSKQIDSKINISEIVTEEVGISLEQFINISVLLIAFSIQTINISDIMANNEVLEGFGVTEIEFKRFVEYYSASYTEIRNSELKENFFFTKPIIKTNTSKYIMVNSFMPHKVLSDGLYWVIRNHYFKLGSQDFVNEFGLYFEKYVENLFEDCLDENMFEKIDLSSKGKKADWILNLGYYTIIIEQKSMLASIKIKQQYPEYKEVLKYLNKYEEAFNQLNSTENKIKGENKKICKFILHYDSLYVTKFIKDHLVSKRKNEQDSNIYFIDISELEKLVYFIKTDISKFYVVLDELLKRDKDSGNYSSGAAINNIFNDFNIKNNNLYIEKYKNHFNRYLDNIQNK